MNPRPAHTTIPAIRRSRAAAATIALAASAVLFSAAADARAQQDIPSKVPIAFNRYYTYEETTAHLQAIAAAYPDLVELRSLGKSLQGRDMWVAIVNAPRTGPHDAKPAMWIDGNIHGNEIQASEVVLYSLWYLTKAYGHNEKLTTLLDHYAFYLMPMVNPDGRAWWFDQPNTSSTSRSNQRPVDNDRDGLLDEDPPDDLDGDGSITGMWKKDPNGRWRRSEKDPRVFERVAPDETGQWEFLGSEGIDNDADGQTNEDGPGGDDMNRNWPGDWQPDYVQGGAGPYPFSAPETLAVGRFVLERPNIAAFQSYHNSGGMVLRGPGIQYREALYTPADTAVYDEMGRIGEQLLPYYRYMIIYRDLYSVHGGEVTWAAENLGIFSFTNELWNEGKYFQRDVANPSPEQDWLWRDRMVFGQTFKDFTEVDHPEHGTILVGGLNKWASRSTPNFLLEEECHRNFAFTVYHADQMPLLAWGQHDAKVIADLGGGRSLWQLTLEIKNEKLIPTRAALARIRNVGRKDILTAEPTAGVGVTRVVASGRVNNWNDERTDFARFEPHRLLIDDDIPSKGRRLFRYYVEAAEGAQLVLTYTSEKAATLTRTLSLKPTDGPVAPDE